MLNDHVLKAQFPGALTGKLSDLAGMVFFPLLLVALTELVDRREPFRPRRSALIGAAAITGSVFGLINLWHPAGEVWAWSLGALQWPFRWAVSGGEATWLPVRHTLDPSDLIAVPLVGIAMAVGWRRTVEDSG